MELRNVCSPSVGVFSSSVWMKGGGLVDCFLCVLFELVEFVMQPLLVYSKLVFSSCPVCSVLL